MSSFGPVMWSVGVVWAGLQTAVHSAMALKGVRSVGGSGGGVRRRPPRRRGWWWYNGGVITT
jgi:hypothetical protein